MKENIPMTIDPETQIVKLTSHDLSKLLHHISKQSEIIVNLVEMLKDGPVNYPEFNNLQDYSFNSINELNEDIFDDFPDIQRP